MPLHTRGLPQLVPTKRLTPPKPGTDAHKAWSAIHRAPPGPERWKVRSKTFVGMAEAWADQWGGYAMEVAAKPVDHPAQTAAPISPPPEDRRDSSTKTKTKDGYNG